MKRINNKFFSVKPSLLKLFSIASVALSSCVFAQTNTNWTEVNLSVTDNQVIPAYAEFATAASGLQENALAFCGDVNADALTVLQASYQQTMDSWQAVQHIQFGPVTYFNWNFRLQYWPDDNGTGGRQLATLIASKDQNALTADNFSSPGTSIGVQGFPALERLLFAEQSLVDMQVDDYRCQVVQAIAENISTIASGISERWQNEFRETVAQADDRGFFESAEDATIDFLKALVETVPRLQEQKLLPALGDSYAAARVRRAESWRSEVSLRNLKVNLMALSELFNGAGEIGSNSNQVVLNSVLETEDVAEVNAVFEKITETLSMLPDSMLAALENEADYIAVKSVVEQLEELDDALENALKNTDLYLGFNSLDGD